MGVNAAPALARLGVLIAAVCLGSAALLLTISQASPSTAAFLRCALAILALAPFAVAEVSRHGLPGKATVGIAAGAGAFLGFDYIMWAQSVYDAGVGVSTVLISVQAVVFPALVWLLHREHPGRLFLWCVPVMLGGMLLTGGAFGVDPGAAAPLRGAILGVLSGVLYGVYIYGTHRCRVLSPALIVTPVLIATTAACLVTLIGGLVLGGFDFDLGLSGWAAMVGLAVLGQAGAWGLLAVFSTRLPVTETASLMLAQPITAVLLGTLLAGEQLAVGQWLGIVIVVAVVWLVSGGMRVLSRRCQASAEVRGAVRRRGSSHRR